MGALLRYRIGRRVEPWSVSTSDRQGEFGERRGDSRPGWDVESKFVVSAAKVMEEGVSGDDHLGCSMVRSRRISFRRCLSLL
jgi:hypothetical protein